VVLQSQLRDEPALLPAAIDEILRIHGPLVTNRRIATRPVEFHGRTIGAGERITLHWTSANRDGRVFKEPYSFRLDRHSRVNLLYGAGIHFCPGAPLARLELRVCIEELLEHTTEIQLISGKPPTNAIYPASGFAVLPVHLRQMP
jgi:cytochrome P450